MVVHGGIYHDLETTCIGKQFFWLMKIKRIVLAIFENSAPYTFGLLNFFGRVAPKKYIYCREKFYL